MTDYIVQGESLTAIADKIREKTGGSAPLEFPDDFIAEIDRLTSAPVTPDDSIIFYSRNEFTLSVADKSKHWDGYLYYSTDYDIWTIWNGEEISSRLNGMWHLIYLKGNNNSRISGNATNRFVVQGSAITCAGNMINLLNKAGTPTYTGCFNYLFSDNGNIDFDLVLPAEIIDHNGSYYYMFSGCSSMTKAPALPSINLNTGCYMYMFNNCISLKEAPALPATDLVMNCYRYMFAGCKSLKTAPALPSTVMKDQCYDFMFADCTSLKTPPALPATSLHSSCYRGMFSGCTSLEALPELPATTLTLTCYNGMFTGCSKIKLSTSQTDDYQTPFRIPSIGEGTVGTQSLNNMFASTGGTFTGTPTINTKYYTSNEIIPAT